MRASLQLEVVYSVYGDNMNPDVPERERSPTPKRRWKPLGESEKRSMPGPSKGHFDWVPAEAVLAPSNAWDGLI